MLPKIHRLRNTKDIKVVFRRGRGVREDFLFLKSAKNKLQVPRFAFIVSHKISKKASSRNIIKRRLREAVRSFLPETEAGLDVVIIVQKNIENENFRAIRGITEKIFKRAGII